MIASRIPTKTVRDVAVRMRQDSGVEHLSGLIDADVERSLEKSFAKSLDMLNQFRTNLLDERPALARNEALIKNFVANTKALYSQLVGLPVQMPKMPLKLKTLRP